MKDTAFRFAVATCLYSPISAARVQAQNCTPLPAGVVAWYRAENDGSDFFGAHPGSLKNGVGFAQGIVGQAFSFDGVDDVIEVPNSNALNPGVITLEAWVKPSSIKAGSRIVSKELTTGSCSPPYGLWSVDVRSDTGNRAVFHFDIAGTLHNLPSTSPIPTTQFTHIAATFDGSAGRIYINGVEENMVSVNGTLLSSTVPVVIGNAGAEARACFTGLVEFNGLIDEVAIYNRALAAEEIRAIFNAGSAGKCSMPELSIQWNGNTLMVAWSPSIEGFLLEQANSLSAPVWPPGPGGNPATVVPAASEQTFYRLRRP